MISAVRKRQSGLAGLGVPLDLEPMEAKLVAELPKVGGWQFEPKWDGFRCLAFRSGGDVEIKSKSGKSLSQFFPEVLAMLRSFPARTFFLDGELVIPVDDALSFDALQMRLHPAESRIRRLSKEAPATLVAFDCLLRKARRPLLHSPFSERRQALEEFFGELEKTDGVVLTPFTREQKKANDWLKNIQVSVDGIVAKRLDQPYRPGERALLKIKCLRTADCVVGGFRYEAGGTQVGSLLLGLYDNASLLHHVGITSAIASSEKPDLTKRLEKRVAAPGFTGDAPGGPSRWSTARTSEWQPLQTKLVVEVRYDHVTGNRFRHGTRLLRWRPDKSPAQCTLEQLAAPAPPTRLQ